MEFIKNINGLKGILATIIVFEHSRQHADWANLAVCAFFIISGFLLQSRYLEINKQYSLANVVKSMRKIYPLHLFFLIIFFLMQWLLLHKDFCNLFFSFGVHASLLQSWFPVNLFEPLNSVSWFLSTYFTILIIYVLICKFRLKKWVTGVVLISITASFVVGFFVEDGYWWYYKFPLMRLLDFFVGMAIAHFTRNSVFHISMKSLSFVTILVFIVTILMKYYIDLPRFVNFSIIYLPFCSMIVLICIMSEGKEGIVSRFLNIRALQWLGQYSMEIFLTHFLFVRIMFRIWTKTNWLDYLINFVIVFVLSLVTSKCVNYIRKKCNG